jgi:hypothetical protein
MELFSLDSPPTLQKIMDFEKELGCVEQCTFPLDHYLYEGHYYRVMRMRAGSAAVGKLHKKDHVFGLLSGRVILAQDGKREYISAPFLDVIKGGGKKAVFAIEDSVMFNIHLIDFEIGEFNDSALNLIESNVIVKNKLLE